MNVSSSVPYRRFPNRKVRRSLPVHEENLQPAPKMNGMDKERAAKVSDRYAGFWMRFWAYLFDLLVIFSINGLIVYPLFRGFDISTQLLGVSLELIVAGAVGYLYYILMTKLLNQTLGKMLFGLKVIRTDRAPLTWSDVLFREGIGRFLHKVFAPFIFLYLVVAFSSKKQGIHDMIANTYVIHE